MSDIDVLLFNEAYLEPPPFPIAQIFKSKTKKILDCPVSLERSVIKPLTEQGIIARTLSSGPTKWQGVVRIPLADESISTRLDGVERFKGRFKRLDIKSGSSF
jgi:DNA polymerase beta